MSFTLRTTPTGAILSPVTATDLTVAFGGRTVLSGIDLVVPPGRRTGLVGENGSGKSTLLRALAGRLPERSEVSGAVAVPVDLAFLGQEAPFRAEHRVGEILAATLAPLRLLVDDVERLGESVALAPDDDAVAARYAHALDLAVASDAWDAPRRAELAAARLGLEAIGPERLVGSLSGGQRTRLALAALMTTRPSALLLDEPTNHLDDDALDVLAGFLNDLPGVVLLASHDRVLLDEVCTDLFDMEPGEFGTDGSGGRRFTGGWSQYESWRANARARWEETYAVQQEELKELRAATQVRESDVAHGRGPTDHDKFIHAFKGSRVQKTVSRRRKNAEVRLAEAEDNQVRKPRAPLSFRGALGAQSAGGQMVTVRDLVVGGRMALDRLDVSSGERLLVTGPNGVGKSTLLGVLSGRISPDAGQVTVAARRVGELTQDVDLPRDRTPLQVFTEAVGEDRVDELRGFGLIGPRDLNRPTGLLSVGQRRRLGLALVLAEAPDLLLLDELTNHLSLALVGELEDALQQAPATLVLASHDRWLRRRWRGSTLALAPGPWSSRPHGSPVPGSRSVRQ